MDMCRSSSVALGAVVMGFGVAFADVTLDLPQTPEKSTALVQRAIDETSAADVEVFAVGCINCGSFHYGKGTLAAYGLHLVAEGHIRERGDGELSYAQQLRQKQFKALLEDAKKFDHAILCGDFNAQMPFEYKVFTDAGYRLANCSERFGTTATLRNIPADNIIVSPTLDFQEFRIPDNYRLNTDHRPLLAIVTPVR